MGKQRRSHCRDCMASGNDTRISKAGYCGACGDARLLENIRGLQDKDGPEYVRWAAGMAAHVEALAIRLGVGDSALDGGGTSSRSALPPSP
jgi:hypothetical protein